jgi:AbrB family looped-hinge helix DNA binding protein
MVIPAELRHNMGLKEGDELLVSVEGKRLVLETEAALLERLYATVGEPPEGELVSESLMRERREEAQRESEER